MGHTQFILVATVCLILCGTVIRIDRTREQAAALFYITALGTEHITAHVFLRGIGYTVSGRGVVADNGAPAGTSASYNASRVA